MRRVLSAIAALLSLTSAFAQGIPGDSSRGNREPRIEPPSGWRAPYEVPRVSETDFHNSRRIDSLLRGGQLYLSLKDAIALAIENNLDIELQRFGPKIADTDLLRAQGGGLLRGIPFTIRELPAGVGGTGSPLLTTVGANAPVTQITGNPADTAILSGQEPSLSILGPTPFATGPRIPAFDPAIVGQLNWSHQTTPQTNSFVAGTSALIQNNLLGNLGYQQGFASGGSVNFGYNSTRQSTNSARTDLNPYTNGSLGLSVTQPLLQGFGLALNRRFIRIAKNSERISDALFKQQLIATVASVVRLYWDMVSLHEDVKVKQQAQELAQRLYENNKAQVDVGTMAPLEVKRAQAEVARSRQDLTNSESLLLQQELILKTVLSRTGTSDPLLGSARIVPLDRIEIPRQEKVTPMQDLVASAFQNRPDLTQAQIQIDNSEIYLKGSRNALLPELDFIGSVQNSALAGQVNPLPPVGTSPGAPFLRNADPIYLGGSGTLLSQLFSRNFPNYAVGVQLNIPLRNRVAQADVIRDELQVRQSQVRLKQLENQVRLEVENALLALQRARASYDAAVETRQLQEEALDAERQRYEVGASTTFIVIQYQRDLAQARSTEVATQGTYAKAKAALDRATGQTLVDNGVEVEEAYRGRVSSAPSPIPAIP